MNKAEQFNSIKSKLFILTQDQLNQIRELLDGRLLESPEALVALLKRSQTVRLGDGIDLTLPVEDLHSLKQQSIGMGRPYLEYVKEFVEDAVSFQLYGQGRLR